jgi:hypothetical protein
LAQIGTDGKPLEVLVNDRPWMTILGNGGLRTSTLCIPEHLQGTVHEVKLQIYVPGGCGQTDVREFTLDNFQFVSEAACAAPNATIDGGFESSYEGSTETPWSLSRSDSSNNDAYSAIPLDPVNARSGDGVLRIYTNGSYTYGDAKAKIRIQVPPAGGGGGPAIRFWYRSENPGASSITVTPGAYVIPASAQPNVYEEHEICLNTDWTGQIVPIIFDLDGGTSGTGPADHWIDDFEVVLSNGC